jgi:hypothetical protein
MAMRARGKSLEQVSPEQGENGMDIQISCITVNDLK